MKRAADTVTEGVYIFTNKVSGTVLDLYGESASRGETDCFQVYTFADVNDRWHRREKGE